MKIGLFLKIFVFFLCAFFTWFNFNALKESPFSVLSLGVFFIILYFGLVDCKRISVRKIKKDWREKKESSFELFLNHPAKMLVMYFFILSCLGGGLLSLPLMQIESVNLIDVFFTAVSATCVTGLTTIDISQKFSFIGQFIILILIQLGGLGIMSIASIALHSVGRISLKHEKILTSDIGDDVGELKKSLLFIVKFTFLVEFIGGLFLSLFFYLTGENGVISIWKGIFTSISAFCNAGFSLEGDSFISFQNNQLILYTVSFLIILGGFAPITVLVIPKWLKGKKVSVHSRIAIITTISLLLFGMFSFLFFEWNNLLSGLSISDKIHNAWFMSVSTRTAGFSSIDILKMTDPMFIITLFFMFVGGNPGGTAGGIKTVTLAILVLTFWNTISNKRTLVVSGREIRRDVVYRAITILISTLCVAIIVLFMLIATQTIQTKILIFEVISALGTAGISMNATGMLDEIGKVIIILTMFTGRIGALTLLTILKGKQSFDSSKYPPAKISLT